MTNFAKQTVHSFNEQLRGTCLKGQGDTIIITRFASPREQVLSSHTNTQDSYLSLLTRAHAQRKKT